MFDYEDTIFDLGKLSDMKEKKRLKFLKNLLNDEDFMEWLFNPKNSPQTTEKVSKLYDIMTKPKTMRALADMIQEYEPQSFDRTQATFMWSICNMAIKDNNDRITELDKQKKDGDISNRDYKDLSDKIDEYTTYIERLIKMVQKIVKKDAKRLSKETNLPRHICATALYNAPDPKYIDRYKIGYYTNNLLNTVYADVVNFGDFEDNVKWRPYFKEIFGKDNVAEVATFILLEGVHRIDKYKNSSQVRACWDSLTGFALKELNDAPDSIRSHMLELYIKRIDKMFSNGSFDLRVNLLTLDEIDFPKLAKTITGYADKIKDILSAKK